MSLKALPTILLTGAEGQIGKEIALALQQGQYSHAQVYRFGRDQLDLAQPKAIRQHVEALQPSLIINAAAYTAVDKAEAEPDQANLINAVAPTVLAEAAQALGAAFIHISTDYVFDGKANLPYEVDAPTLPLSCYGQSKLAGERGIRQACDRHLILRTAWVYGAYGKGNFVKTMLRLGAERDTLNVVYDQVGSPTWAYDIAQAIAQLATNSLASSSMAEISAEELWGVYHYTSSGVASWYDFAVAIFEEAEQLGLKLKVSQVLPITTDDYPLPAARPAYSVLSHRKLSTLLGQVPPHWRVSLRTMLKQYISKL